VIPIHIQRIRDFTQPLVSRPDVDEIDSGRLEMKTRDQIGRAHRAAFEDRQADHQRLGDPVEHGPQDDRQRVAAALLLGAGHRHDGLEGGDNLVAVRAGSKCVSDGVLERRRRRVDSDGRGNAHERCGFRPEHERGTRRAFVGPEHVEETVVVKSEPPEALFVVIHCAPNNPTSWSVNAPHPDWMRFAAPRPSPVRLCIERRSDPDLTQPQERG